MVERLTRKRKKDAKRAAIVKNTAELTGVSQRYVNMVLSCDRENETVFNTYMTLNDGYDLLVKAVKEAVKL